MGGGSLLRYFLVQKHHYWHSNKQNVNENHKNMAEEERFIFILVFGSVLLLISILFFLLDAEYRNNFQSGNHSYADDRYDQVAVHWSSAKDQFNQIAIKFEKFKVCLFNKFFGQIW